MSDVLRSVYCECVLCLLLAHLYNWLFEVKLQILFTSELRNLLKNYYFVNIIFLCWSVYLIKYSQCQWKNSWYCNDVSVLGLLIWQTILFFYFFFFFLQYMLYCLRNSKFHQMNTHKNTILMTVLFMTY